MSSLPEDVFRLFMKGTHVMRRKQGVWSSICSDMFIEATFTRFGHGQAGITGNKLRPETLKAWALSFYICGKIVQDIKYART